MAEPVERRRVLQGLLADGSLQRAVTAAAVAAKTSQALLAHCSRRASLVSLAWSQRRREVSAAQADAGLNDRAHQAVQVGHAGQDAKGNSNDLPRWLRPSAPHGAASLLASSPVREHAPVILIGAILSCTAVLLGVASLHAGRGEETPSVSPPMPGLASTEVGPVEALEAELERAQRRIKVLEAENALLLAIAQGTSEVARSLNQRLAEAGFGTEELPPIPTGQRGQAVNELREAAGKAAP